MRVLKSLFAHKQCQSQETLFTLTDQSGSMNMFSLMVPLFFRQLCTVLLGTISMVILTRVSEEAVTAVSVANTVINIPLNLITMIANGMMIILMIWYRDTRIKVSLGGMSPAEFRIKMGVTV